MTQPLTLAAAFLSLGVVLAVGVWSWRRTRSARDYFIAGQTIGLWPVAMATMASAFSGFVFLGGPGLTYRLGVRALFINLPIGFTAGLLCWVVARRLRLLAEVREVYTIPDALTSRFDCRATTGLSALAMVVGCIGYLAAQLLALGILLESLFGTQPLLGSWSLPMAMGTGLAVLLFYSVAGGMLAGIYTDLVQGSLMLAAAVLVFGRALSVSGGWRQVSSAIAESESFAGFFDPFTNGSALTAIGFFFVFGVGVLGQPHMVHKFFMMKDPRQLKWMPLILATSQSLCLLIWLGVGFAVPALVAQGRLAPLVRPDDAAPVFLLEMAPQALAGLVLAGVLAAIMSTADAVLNIAAAAIVRDLPRWRGRALSDELKAGRRATVVVAIGAALLGLFYGDLVALLGTFAFGTFAAALAPTLAIGLNWRRVTGKAAAASIGTGLGLNLLLEAWTRYPDLFGGSRFELPAGVIPSAVALAASLTVLLAATWLSRAGTESELPDDIVAVLES